MSDPFVEPGSTVMSPSAAATPDRGRPAALPRSADAGTLTGLPRAVIGHETPLARYELLQELGRGGMGVVYLARDRDLDRLVALKMIGRADGAGDAEVVRFRTEAEAVAHLQHPNIVQIHAVGQLEGAPYLALEYCAGGSLEDRLDGTPLAPPRAAALLETLARAMQHAHERGIVHRDLKPANVLLTPEGTLKITDFGLAKRLDRPQGPTRSGAVLGTPSYMAPEQARNRGVRVDARADVYALGAILYEMVTGRPPFKGESVLDTLHQVVSQEPVRPSQLQPRCPRDLETIILKCLRKDPRQRYGSAGELAEDCAAFQRGEPIRARATPLWERAGKWVRRHPAGAALLGAVCLAAVGLLAILMWHDATLEAAVAEARTAEKKALHEASVNEARARAEGMLLEGQRAFGREEDWEEARLQATRALDTLGSRDELKDLIVQAEQLRDSSQRRLEDEAEREGMLRHYQKFLEQRDEALFHASLFTGLDLPTNLEKTRAAARAALAEFGVREESPGPPNLAGQGLEERQRAEVVSGCSELLLVLAEALAHPLPGQPVAGQQRQVAEAVRLLELAAERGVVPARAAHWRLARYLDQLGRPTEAAEHRAQAQALPPAGAVDYFLMGDERRLQGDLPRASQDFENALRRQPNHFWAQYGLAFCCLRLQRLPEARAGLTACLGHRPGFAWLYALRGFAQSELGEFQAADDDFAQALQLATEDVTRYGVYANRGVLRFRQAQAAEPWTALAGSATDLPACRVSAGLAEVYRRQQLAAAAADLREAVRLQPGNYQAHLSLALVYVRQQQAQAARGEFQEAIRLAPQLADPYRCRADFAWQGQDSAAALEDLERALRLEPTGSRAAEDHTKRGQILQHDGKYEEAVAAYEEARRLHADHLDALRLEAVALLELRRYAEAARCFDHYLNQVDPGRSAPGLAEAYRLRGLTRTQVGDHTGALQDFTRALELQPDAATHGYRGWIYLAEGAAKPALDDFEEALRLDPTEADAYNGRGNARARLGHHVEGVADAEEALHRRPRNTRTLHTAAGVYAQAAIAVAADPARSPTEAEATRHTYEERALDLLRDTLNTVPAAGRGRYWSEQVSGDPDLEPLRRLPEFQKLAP